MKEKGKNLPFVDSHAHPDSLPLVKETIARAGIEVWINSTRPEDVEDSARMAKSLKGRLFLGIHPAFAHSKIPEGWEERLKDADGIGEVGLDGKYEVPMDLQVKVLRRQLELAERSNLPVVLHSRRAASMVLEEVSTFDLSSVLFHWFSGSDLELKRILDRGYFVSVGPTVLYSKRSRRVAETAYSHGLLLLETDSPVYYAPLGKEADPTLVISVYFEVANLLRKPLDEFVLDIFTASRRFLGKGF